MTQHGILQVDEMRRKLERDMDTMEQNTEDKYKDMGLEQLNAEVAEKEKQFLKTEREFEEKSRDINEERRYNDPRKRCDRGCLL